MAAPEVHVTVEVRVRSTEDPEKVRQAVLNLFPDAELETTATLVRGTTRSIATLLRKASEERVRDAARGALWRGRIDEGATRFELAKQPAAVGRINFNEVTHPLGDLSVLIETRSLEALLDHIAPTTRQELAALEKMQTTNARRAAMHLEERDLAAIGTDIDAGWVDETVDDSEEEE